MAKKTRFGRFFTAASGMSFPKKKIQFEVASEVLRALKHNLKKKSDKRIMDDLVMALMLGR